MTQEPTNSPEFNSLIKQIKNMGFDGVLYSFYPMYMYNKKIQPVLHTCGKFTSFAEHYLKNNYGNRDFIMRLALQGQTEIDWWQEINAGNVNDEEKEVTEDAKHNFGIHHGFTIIIPFYKFAAAAISIISTNDGVDNFQSIKNMHLTVLHKHVNEYHEHVIDSRKMLQLFVNPILDKLNNNAKRVLKHLISGRPMREIPDISQKFAEKILLGLRDDFGGVTTNQLIHILGIINLQKYL